MLHVILAPHRASLKANTADAQKVFAMLKLIPRAEVARARPPQAYVLVIDTSGSMREYADQTAAQEAIAQQGLGGVPNRSADGTYQGYNLPLPTKLDKAVEAAHAVVDDDRFLPSDQIAIVHFDDDARTLLPLTPLADKDSAHQAIEALRQHSGGTHLARGLQLAQQALGKVPADVAKRLVLLTDGKTFDEPRCRPIAGQLAATNTPIIAVGIGDEYNEGLMIDLANISQGRAYHLQTMQELRQTLDIEVATSVKEVVTDLQATLAMVRGVALDSLARVYPSLAEVSLSEQPYRLGNVAAGDFTVYVLEFTVAGIARPPSRVRIAQVGLAGNAPGLGRREEFPVQDLFLNFTTDEAAVARVDEEVLGYVQQKNVDRLVDRALRTASRDPAEARRTLQVAAGMTQRLGNARATQLLERAMSELEQTGAISAGTVKTVRVGGRTQTVKPAGTQPAEGGLSDEEIRRLTGT